MQRVGVTGAAGFIGSHLCDRLLAEGYEVVGVDDLSFGSIANLESCLQNPAFSFEVLDCTRRRAAAGGVRRLRRDHASRGEEDPALRGHAPDARGQRRRRERGVLGVALALDADLDRHLDVRRLRRRHAALRRGRQRSCSGRRRRRAGHTRSRSCTTSTRARARRGARPQGHRSCASSTRTARATTSAGGAARP